MKPIKVPALCGCRPRSGSISIAVIVSLIMYFVAMAFFQNLLQFASVKEIPAQIYVLAGMLFGYTQVTLILYFPILVIVGLIIGAITMSGSKALIGSVTFFVTQLLLFFVLGLLILGQSTDYEKFINGFMYEIIIGVLCVIIPAIIVGAYIGMKSTPIEVATAPVFRRQNYPEREDVPSIRFVEL